MVYAREGFMPLRNVCRQYALSFVLCLIVSCVIVLDIDRWKGRVTATDKIIAYSVKLSTGL